jgi:hypothetical protein
MMVWMSGMVRCWPFTLKPTRAFSIYSSPINLLERLAWRDGISESCAMMAMLAKLFLKIRKWLLRREEKKDGR